jgi:iron complex outermembrane receptor protein
MTLQPNNPVFGLNAVGGAVSIEMKNGFTYHGTQLEGLMGSFGRQTATVQSGAQNDNWSIYAAADARPWLARLFLVRLPSPHVRRSRHQKRAN